MEVDVAAVKIVAIFTRSFGQKGKKSHVPVKHVELAP
jgi:hypothetical protein